MGCILLVLVVHRVTAGTLCYCCCLLLWLQLSHACELWGHAATAHTCIVLLQGMHAATAGAYCDRCDFPLLQLMAMLLLLGHATSVGAGR